VWLATQNPETVGLYCLLWNLIKEDIELEIRRNVILNDKLARESRTNRKGKQATMELDKTANKT